MIANRGVLSKASLVGFGLALLMLLVLHQSARPAMATNLDVCPTCIYTTLQAAIAAANNGDTLRVAQGHYTGTMVFAGDSPFTGTLILTKSLTLLGGYNSNFSQRDPRTFTTTIDGQNQPWPIVEVFQSDSVIDGFAIVNSASSGIHVYTATVQIKNNRIENARKSGIEMWDSPSALIQGNTIVSNTADWGGGGISAGLSVVTITDNLIAYNAAVSTTESFGGGIFIWRNTKGMVENNQILSNTSANFGGGIDFFDGSFGEIRNNVVAYNRANAQSGGIEIRETEPVVVADNQVFANTAGDATRGGGGGISTCCGKATITISHNDVYSNTAYGGGTGIDIGNHTSAVVDANFVYRNTVLWWGAGIFAANSHLVTITNNVVVTNTGNGIWFYMSSGLVVNNTIADNLYEGFEGNAATASNNIVVHNGECGFRTWDNDILIHSFNLVYGNGANYCETATEGANEIHADPLFVNRSALDYRIRYGSPAMDAGTLTNAPASDKEGVLRPQNGKVDIGAYEISVTKTYMPLATKP